MSLFDELMQREEYKKLFENYPDYQRQYIIDSVKNFIENSEKNLLEPIKVAIETQKNSEKK